ncbi:hypothetical protein THICB3510052 [Thiomonas sp. CB3]|nr:hypothetical protein THICB3510052 [Thiomonas sp. CB3]
MWNMKLRTAPRPYNPFNDFGASWDRDDRLMAMELPRVRSAARVSEDDWQDICEQDYFEQMTRPSRLRAQIGVMARLSALSDAHRLANFHFVASAINSFFATALRADPQPAALGLAALTIAPRILSQRPIIGPHPRAAGMLT